MKVIVKSINEKNERDEFFYDHLKSLVLRRRAENIALTVNGDYCITMDPDTTINICSNRKVIFEPSAGMKYKYKRARTVFIKMHDDIHDLLRIAMKNGSDDDWMLIHVSEKSKHINITYIMLNPVITDSVQKYAGCVVYRRLNKLRSQAVGDDFKKLYLENIRAEIDKLNIGCVDCKCEDGEE